MILLRQIFLFLDLVRLEARPIPMAAGAVLGVFIGGSPVLTPQWLLCLLFAVVFRFHPIATFASALVSYIVLPWFDPLLDPVGLYFLKSATLRHLWAWLFHSPLVPFTQFNNSVVLGGFVIGSILTLPTFLLGRWILRKYGSDLRTRLQYTALWTHFHSSYWYRIYGEFRRESLRPKYVRPEGVALVTIIGLLSLLTFLFLADDLIKGRIEATASRIHGAKVEIGSLHLGFLDGKLALKDIEIADPEDSQRNLFEIKHMGMDFLPRTVLKNKLVFGELRVSGVSYGTRRTESGLMPETENSYGVVNLMSRSATGYYESVRKALKSNPLKYLDRLSTGLNLNLKVDQLKENLQALKAIDRQWAEIDKVSQSWTKLRLDLPTVAWLQDKETRVTALSTATRVPASQQIEPLEQEIRRVAQTTNELADSLRAQILKIQDGLEDLGPTIDRDVAQIHRDLDLPDLHPKDLTNVLLGNVFLEYLERITYWIDLSRRKMPLGDSSERMLLTLTPAPRGTNVQYANLSGNPVFIIPTGKLTAFDDKEGLKMNGEFQGLTTEPAFHGIPLKFSLDVDLPAAGIRALKTSGIIDHTWDAYQERLSFKIDEMHLKDVVLHQSPNLTIFIEKAKMSLSFSAEFINNRLHAFWNIQLRDALYRVRSRYTSEQQTLTEILAPLTTVSLSGKADGALDQLELESQSNLGRELAEGLRRRFRHSIAAVDDTLRKNILDQLDTRRNELASRTDQLRNETLGSVIRIQKILDDLSQSLEQLKARNQRTETAGPHRSKKVSKK